MSAVLSWAADDGLPAQSFVHASRSRPRRSAPGELPPEVEQAVWRGSDLGHASGTVVSSGFAALDAELPGGGWPTRGLTEVLSPQPSVLEWRLIGPALQGIVAAGGHIVVIGDGVRRASGEMCWDVFQGEGDSIGADRVAEREAALRSDSTADLMFTSGTTGRPKGAVMPHGHLAQKARALVQALGWQPSDRLLHAMPLHHAHGLFMTTHCVLCVGASMLLAKRFEAGEVVAQLPQVTVFSGVPTMYHRMADVPGLLESGKGVRIFVSASAPLPADVLAKFEQRSGHRLVECWGMYETMTNTATPTDRARRPGTVGKPLPGVQVRVLDDKGVPLAPGQRGLLAIRSETRFSGYWRRPPEQQARFEDGFFVTGDLGFIDGEGNVSIAGRTGDVIISGGYNVYPKEVELALEQMDSLAQVAVFALPHPDFGEAVAAAVVVRPGRLLEPQDIAAALKLRLASYKIPKAIFQLEALPVTELGKVQRRVLAQRFAGHFAPSPAHAAP